MNCIISPDIINRQIDDLGVVYMQGMRDACEHFAAYVTKWMQHAARLQGKATGVYNQPYYQGRVSLASDIDSELYNLKLDIVRSINDHIDKSPKSHD